MSEPESATESRQVRRTRETILRAFRDLFLARRYREIRVTDIIDAANVGRSTFYDHFANKDEVLLSSMSPLLEVFIDAAVGKADPQKLRAVLTHFRAESSRARSLFSYEVFFKIVDRHAELIEDALPQTIAPVTRKLTAMQTAAAQLSIIRAWTTGQIVASTDEIAAHLLRQQAMPC